MAPPVNPQVAAVQQTPPGSASPGQQEQKPPEKVLFETRCCFSNLDTFLCPSGVERGHIVQTHSCLHPLRLFFH